jgi:hypothetical protein
MDETEVIVVQNALSDLCVYLLVVLDMAWLKCCCLMVVDAVTVAFAFHSMGPNRLTTKKEYKAYKLVKSRVFACRHCFNPLDFLSYLTYYGVIL